MTKPAIKESVDAGMSDSASLAAAKKQPKRSRAKLAVVKTEPAPAPAAVDIERAALAALLEHLTARGFAPVRLFNGDDLIPFNNDASPSSAIVETIMASAQSTLMFCAAHGNAHGVFIVPSNGADLIGNWSYDEDDADGFNAAMVAFDAIASA